MPVVGEEQDSLMCFRDSGFASHIFKTLLHQREITSLSLNYIYAHYCGKTEELNLGFLFSILSVHLTNTQMM